MVHSTRYWSTSVTMREARLPSPTWSPGVPSPADRRHRLVAGSSGPASGGQVQVVHLERRQIHDPHVRDSGETGRQGRRHGSHGGSVHQRGRRRACPHRLLQRCSGNDAADADKLLGGVAEDQPAAQGKIVSSKKIALGQKPGREVHIQMPGNKGTREGRDLRGQRSSTRSWRSARSRSSMMQVDRYYQSFKVNGDLPSSLPTPGTPPTSFAASSPSSRRSARPAPGVRGASSRITARCGAISSKTCGNARHLDREAAVRAARMALLPPSCCTLRWPPIAGRSRSRTSSAGSPTKWFAGIRTSSATRRPASSAEVRAHWERIKAEEEASLSASGGRPAAGQGFRQPASGRFSTSCGDRAGLAFASLRARGATAAQHASQRARAAASATCCSTSAGSPARWGSTLRAALGTNRRLIDERLPPA